MADNSESYEEFIVESWSGEPAKLNAGVPFPDHMVNAYFTRDVLVKYINNSEKYEVRSGVVECDEWIIMVDNDHPEYVIVSLRQLRLLPYLEQKYWRSFNEYPVPLLRGLSAAAFGRQILGEWTDADSMDFRFKSTFIRLRETFYEKYCWELFQQLPDDKKYIFDSLSIPIVGTSKELDDLLFSLHRLLIEQMNTDAIKKHLGLGPSQKAKPTSLLDKFLTHEGYRNEKTSEYVELLVNIVDYRNNCIGHINEVECRRAKFALDIRQNSNPQNRKDASEYALWGITEFMASIVSWIEPAVRQQHQNGGC